MLPEMVPGEGHRTLCDVIFDTEKEGLKRVTSRMDARRAPGALAHRRREGEADIGRQTE